MKIISKYKDYYDWVVGLYGEDPMMVYPRQFEYTDRPSDLASDKIIEEHRIHIAGESFLIYQLGKDFYHTSEELMELWRIIEEKNLQHPRSFYLGGWYWRDEGRSLKYFQKFFDENNGKPTTINEKLRVPVLKEKTSWSSGGVIGTTKLKGGGEQKWTSILLEDYGFAKWYDPKDMFQKIYAFISYLKDHPEIPNKQTNDEKIMSHGFDLKKSFRHRKS